jgi:hypothetical protein
MTSSQDDLLRDSTLVATTLDAVPVADVGTALAQHGVVRLRGLYDPEVIQAIRTRMAARFDCRNDRKHDARDTEAVRTNFQKLVVGGITGVNELRSLARLVRMLYNPIFAEDVHGMRAHFIRLARLRNRLFGLREDFAVEGTDDGYWTASRVHQYPRGGGFMVPHRDMYSRAAVTETGATYVQVFLLMSHKGEDFHEGGAFLERDGRRVYYEDGCQVGDVIVYDGRSVHGVGDVDPMAPLDMTTFSGRVVAFASLYRHLKPGAQDYGQLAGTARRIFGESSE